MDKLLFPKQSGASFYFKSSPRDFIVKEEPLYDFDGSGEHLILHIRKKELTTWEMLDILSHSTGCKRSEMGYAGLKDKHALTFQYISMPKLYEEKLKDFSHEKMAILERTYHSNKIRIGHLKGNHFSIRLKKLYEVDANKIKTMLAWIEANGMPNYFGHQRFGYYGNNFDEGKALLEGKKRLRDRKKRAFLVSAYQSHLFNHWLSKRIEISRLLESFDQQQCEEALKLPKGSLEGTKKQPSYFKVLKGDVMMHYPYGRLFECEDVAKESERLFKKDAVPTGLLSGKKTELATNSAKLFEHNDPLLAKERGSRRYAWVFPEDIYGKYIPERAHFELGFYLPKGSYATVLLDTLKGAWSTQKDA